jgi:aryl-alcohol dehydrogenase-like predicted oxidoreductase
MVMEEQRMRALAALARQKLIKAIARSAVGQGSLVRAQLTTAAAVKHRTTRQCRSCARKKRRRKRRRKKILLL